MVWQFNVLERGKSREGEIEPATNGIQKERAGDKRGTSAQNPEKKEEAEGGDLGGNRPSQKGGPQSFKVHLGGEERGRIVPRGVGEGEIVVVSMQGT